MAFRRRNVAFRLGEGAGRNDANRGGEAYGSELALRGGCGNESYLKTGSQSPDGLRRVGSWRAPRPTRDVDLLRRQRLAGGTLSPRNPIASQSLAAPRHNAATTHPGSLENNPLPRGDCLPTLDYEGGQCLSDPDLAQITCQMQCRVPHLILATRAHILQQSGVLSRPFKRRTAISSINAQSLRSNAGAGFLPGPSTGTLSFWRRAARHQMRMEPSEQQIDPRLDRQSIERTQRAHCIATLTRNFGLARKLLGTAVRCSRVRVVCT